MQSEPTALPTEPQPLHLSLFNFSVYKSVMAQTVYEFVVQLYVEPFKYGMSNEVST